MLKVSLIVLALACSSIACLKVFSAFVKVSSGVLALQNNWHNSFRGQF